jgi:hypothetical protein
MGPVATHNEWMLARVRPAFSHLQAPQKIQISSDGDILKAIKEACDNELTLSIHADSGLCTELTEQPGRRLLHLVNYSNNDPIKDVLVDMRLPAGCDVDAVFLRSPEHKRDIDLLYEKEEDRVKFVIPSVNIYEIAVVKIK